MKHRASSTHRMDAPDRHNEQKDRQANGHVSLSVCLFLCVTVCLVLQIQCVEHNHNAMKWFQSLLRTNNFVNLNASGLPCYSTAAFSVAPAKLLSCGRTLRSANILTSIVV